FLKYRLGRPSAGYPDTAIQTSAVDYRFIMVMRPSIGAYWYPGAFHGCWEANRQNYFADWIFRAIFYDRVLDRGTVELAVRTDRRVDHLWMREEAWVDRVRKYVLVTILDFCLVIKVSIRAPYECGKTTP